MKRMHLFARRLMTDGSKFDNSSSCPVSADTQTCLMDSETINPLNHMHHPETLQKPSAAQAVPLATARETSSIPTTTEGKWIYPSEQMFFNAMKKKNHNPSERDMKVIVPIHNAVNEQGWRKILEWEEHVPSGCEIKLEKFKGRAKDYTIKARWRQLIGYKLPFDRHDWVIDRCGEKVTYIIDFYSGPNSSFFLDVRPYPTFSGLLLTARRYWSDFFK